METPLLPWEIIERVIDHSGDHPGTLRSLSRTCRQLRPRSLCVIFFEVVLNSRDRIFAFVDFVRANPRLKPLVRSIVIPPTDFGPSLLYLLPNLSKIRCLPSTPQSTQPVLALHHVSLACFGRLGTRIRTLHLLNVSFATYLALTRVLSALANIIHLVCADVSIQAEGDRALLDIARRHLVEKMRLKKLTIDSRSLTGGLSNASAGALLFDPDFAPSTVESLRLIGAPGSMRLPHSPNWSRLRSLVLQLPSFEWGNIADTTMLLRDLYHPTLRELEVGLLRVSQPRLVCVVKAPMRTGTASLWAQEFGEYFPALIQRGALVVKSDQSVLPPGHRARLLALVVSPDSKWVASGSNDSIITLWDATKGEITQRWVAHGYKSVLSFAFSLDGRRLVSVGRDGKVAIWNLDQSARKVSTLKGHTGTVVSCAWSPDGDVVATAAWDETARLWDARTFRQLRTLQMPGNWQMQSVAFSPDGRWLSSKTSRDYWIWNGASGMLHKSIRPAFGTAFRNTDIPAAFCPGSMRLAVAFGSVAVEVWDVSSEAGGRLFVLEQGGWVNDVSFSPDGNLVLAVLENRMMVKIWDAYIGTELFQLKGHMRGVLVACFSPCGRYIASASWDSTVRLWRTSDGSCVAQFCEHDEPVERVAFLPNGKTLLSGTTDGIVVLRRIPDDA